MDPNSDNNHAGGEAPKNPGRRWLLTSGAVAGPLVLTLRGGRAWAVSTLCSEKPGGTDPGTEELTASCNMSLNPVVDDG